MVIPNKLFLCFLGMCFFIFQYHDASNVNYLKSERLERQKRSDDFLDDLKQIRARFNSLIYMFPLSDSFYNALNYLYGEMTQFYKMSESTVATLSKSLKADLTSITKGYESLKKEIYDISGKKDILEEMAEDISSQYSFLSADLVNGPSSAVIEKTLKDLKKKGNDKLNEYVKLISKMFTNMSKLRHQLVGFGQKIVRSLSESRSTDAMNIIENKFCQSDVIKEGLYEEEFARVSEAFNQMKTSFDIISKNNDDVFPFSFVIFAEQILGFQKIKFIELKTAIQLYTNAKTVANKNKYSVSLASGLIDFNYLYELSNHIMELSSVSTAMYNSTQNQNPTVYGDSGDQNE